MLFLNRGTKVQANLWINPEAWPLQLGLYGHLLQHPVRLGKKIGLSGFSVVKATKTWDLLVHIQGRTRSAGHTGSRSLWNRQVPSGELLYHWWELRVNLHAKIQLWDIFVLFVKATITVCRTSTTKLSATFSELWSSTQATCRLGLWWATSSWSSRTALWPFSPTRMPLVSETHVSGMNWENKRLSNCFV